MKKLVSVILTTALLICSATAAYAGTGNVASAGNANYNDLKTTNWAYEAVNVMSHKGIVKGYNDGSFKPSNTVTYGEFIKMALVASTKEDIGNAPSVNPKTGAKQNWAKSYYDKAVELKYFGVTDIKDSQLNKQIPRADMALIISNILGETKIDNYDELEESLKDVNSETKHDYDIIKSYATGIITGYQDNTFKADNTLTRAESATVIYRLVDESKRVMPDSTEETKTTTATEKPLAEMITNYKAFYSTNGYLDKLLARMETYSIDTDSSKFDMTLAENRGTKWIHFPASVNKNLGRRYLVKDNKVLELAQLTPLPDGAANAVYTVDITTVDYIGSLRADNHMLLIVNPFKK